MSGPTSAFEPSGPADLPAPEPPTHRPLRPRASPSADAPTSLPEELFKATCEQAAIGIAHLSFDDKWLWINQRFCEIVGWPREELVSLRLQDITHPDDIGTTLDFAHKVRAGEVPSYAIEKRYVRMDGTTVWGSLTVSPIRSQAGVPSSFVGFLQDVTDRRLAEQRLAARHAATRLLREATGSGLPRGLMEAICRALRWDAAVLWTVDRSDHVLRRVDEWISPRARAAEHGARLFTLNADEELPGRVWVTGDPVWISDLTRQTTTPHTHHAADAGLRGVVVVPITGGAVCGVIELYSAEVQPHDSELLRTLTMIGDEIGQFLEHERAGEFVREMEARKTAIVDAALDCVVSIDAEQRVTEFNPAAERTFGYRRADVIGKPIAELIIPPSLRPRHYAGFARHLAGGAARILGKRVELTAMRADGSEFPIELAITRIPLPGPATFTAFIRDITHRKSAERELQHSLSLLRATLDATADGVLVVSAEGRITSYNKQLPAMFGIPESIFAMGNDSLALSYAARQLKDPDAFAARVRELYAHPEAESFDVLEFRDGRVVERHSRPQRLGGKSVGRVWSFRDVTAPRRAEQELRESEERFRSLAEAAVDGVLVHEQGIVIDANPSFCRMSGYTLAELVGLNVIERIIAPESRARVLENMRAGSTALYEVEAIRKDGTHMVVEVCGRPATYRGRQARVVAVHDITERKRAEQAALRLVEEQAARGAAEAAERRARFLAEASRLLSGSFDYHTTLSTLATLAVPELADYCTVDVTDGGTFTRLGVAHSDPAKEALVREVAQYTFGPRPQAHAIVRVLTEGKPVFMSEITEAMLDASAADATHRELLRQIAPVSLVSVPLLSSGRILGALTLVTSESGRHYGPEDLALVEELARRASLAVENARLFHAAEQATRARDEMMGIVAHDLRNPLSTIRMASELLLEIGGDERPLARKQLEIMRRAADRMNRLIQDLLDVRRIESGTLGVEPRPEPVTSVIGDAVEMLRPLATSSSLRLDAAVPDGLPRVMVDPARVQQVLSNLVGNAIKFTPAGGQITVRAELAADGVCLAVVDTGPGIPPEQLPHIFGRFWQGKRTDKRGVGLGLAIAKAIVEAHRGRIWVESQVGAGTTVYFTVPAAS